MKFALSILIASQLFASAQPLLISRLDGTLWSLDAQAPQLAVQVGANSPAIGTLTNLYNGSLYYIDAKADTLVRDSTVVGLLSWFNHHVWDAQDPHGFAIADDGSAWLASRDDGDTSFLLSLDLNTGRVIPIGPIDGENHSPVNGLLIAWQVPEPRPAVLIVIGLLIVCCYMLAKGGAKK